MAYLLGSIILTSYLTLSFKLVERFRINTFHAIVFNYITCVITGSLVNGKFPIDASTLTENWIPWAALMGATFIFLFNIVGFTAQKIGVSVASVANKLSLVIPFIFSIYFYNEDLSFLKILGIGLALVAVYMVCYRRKEIKAPTEVPDQNFLQYFISFLPIILFVGSGLLDTMIKYVEQAFVDTENQNAYLISAFASAASIGVIIMLINVIGRKHKLSYKAIIAGVAIGIPNYFSIWCLLRVLKINAGRSSAIIPINNMGILLFSAVVAWLAFGEKLTVVNWLGIFFSILSIAFISFG